MINKYLSIALFIIYSIPLSLACFSSLAEEVISGHILGFDKLSNTLRQKVTNIDNSSAFEQQHQWQLNEHVLALLVLSKKNPKQAQKALLTLEQRQDTFNVAEKYLMRVIQANIANKPGQEHKVINWLNQAIAMEKQITALQLQSPQFNQSNLILSKIYARIGQFQKAYDKQTIYFKRFYFHRLALAGQRLTNLNKKYDIDIKLKENELLKSQREYKGLQLAKIQQKNKIQQRNILILVATIVVFFILLYRQLLIKKALGRLAKIDSMTNLYNRKMLFEAGEKLIISGSNLKKTVSVILFDIDDLKGVNEQYGHHVGDEVIKSIASLGIETMRSRDVFSRVAGEQFAAILPGTNLAQAKAFAERLREKVESSHFHHQNIKGTITVSAGIANTADIDVEFELLINAAEQAMHLAKTAGKNCVCCFKQPNCVCCFKQPN